MGLSKINITKKEVSQATKNSKNQIWKTKRESCLIAGSDADFAGRELCRHIQLVRMKGPEPPAQRDWEKASLLRSGKETGSRLQQDR